MLKKVLLCLLPLFAFIFIACDIPDIPADIATEITTEITDTYSNVPKAHKDAFQNQYSIGETISNGNVEWVVLEAEDLGSTLKATNSFFDDCVSNSGKYIKATVQITNNNNDVRSISDLPLYDDQERRFISASGLVGCVAEDMIFFLDHINPGLTEVFVSVYEIPFDAKNVALRTSDLNLLGSDYKFINLGLDEKTETVD